MSAVQAACIAHRNGGSDDYLDEVVDIMDHVDANGDLVRNGKVIKVESSSDEEVASSSSKDDEEDEIILLKTR